MIEPTLLARQLHTRVHIDAINKISFHLADGWRGISGESTGRLIILLADGRWYDLDMEAAEENIAIIEKLLNYGLIYPISGTGDM
jgi:hypothetical protein